ncbi:MAG: hypothetical protein MUE69_34705 [Myxococcota bacterium]|nr:hypothetical protein [Myxococcota bacterium]
MSLRARLPVGGRDDDRAAHRDAEPVARADAERHVALRKEQLGAEEAFDRELDRLGGVLSVGARVERAEREGQRDEDTSHARKTNEP